MKRRKRVVMLRNDDDDTKKENSNVEELWKWYKEREMWSWAIVNTKLERTKYFIMLDDTSLVTYTYKTRDTMEQNNQHILQKSVTQWNKTTK